MDGWKQWFVLLLPLYVRADSKETVVKAIRRQADITPVCMSEDFGLIIFVTCRISTERHQGKECHLLYGKLFDHDCDSRFTLINKNETVFIQLTDLKPLDSGNYTCECSYERGTHVTHLNITVEADEENSTFSGRKIIFTVIVLLSVAATVVITAIIICGHILRRNLHRGIARSSASELPRPGTPRFVDQGDTYTSLQRPASGIYQTISSGRPLHHAGVDEAHIYATITQETDGKEDFCHLYETP